jgi:hypothetical protein
VDLAGLNVLLVLALPETIQKQSFHATASGVNSASGVTTYFSGLSKKAWQSFLIMICKSC